MMLIYTVPDALSESLSSSSDSDVAPVSKRKIIFNPVRRRSNRSSPTTPVSQSYLEQTSPETTGEGAMSRLSKGKPTDLSLDASSGDDDQPLPSRRKNSEALYPVAVSSDDDFGSVELDLTSPRRGDGVSPALKYQQSTLSASPRVHTLQFILGGASKYAPISSLRRPKAVMQPTSKKVQISPSRARKPTSIKSSPILKKNRRLSLTLEQSKISISIDESSSEEESDAVIEKRSPRNCHSNGVATLRSTSVLSEEESDNSLVKGISHHDHRGSSVTKVADSSDESTEDLVSPSKRRRLVRPSGYSLRSKEAAQQQTEDDLQKDLEAHEEPGMSWLPRIKASGLGSQVTY